MSNTWKITAREGRLYLNIPNDWGDEETMLCTHSDEGEAIVPRRWGQDAYRCLYDELQCNEAIKDGDQFEYQGRIVARVEGVHVFEVKPV